MFCCRSLSSSGSSRLFRSPFARFRFLFGYLATSTPAKPCCTPWHRSDVVAAASSGFLCSAFPLPFYFLELLVGLLQAFVFAMLCAVYIKLSTDEKGNRERIKDFPSRPCPAWAAGTKKQKTKGKENMLEILPILAAEAGNFGPMLPLAFAGLGAGVGVGICRRKGGRSGGAQSQCLR